MKKILAAIFIFAVFCFSRCKKDPVVDSNGLPAATQTGANTLGFMLNGQPWTPQGPTLPPTLSIDFDQSYKNGIFSIVAYQTINNVRTQFIIGVRDSLNFMQIPTTLNLNQSSLYSISIDKPCDYFNQLTDVQSSGSLTISKLDKTNHIISGTFNATLSKINCGNIQITDGRFDMKY